MFASEHCTTATLLLSLKLRLGFGSCNMWGAFNLSSSTEHARSHLIVTVCLKNLTASIIALGWLFCSLVELYGKEGRYDRCDLDERTPKKLSQRCHDFFIAEGCFYECDVNAGKYRSVDPVNGLYTT